MIPKPCLFVLFLTFAQMSAPANAQGETTTSPKKPAKVLLVGTFHFYNPGLDVVKTKSFDILSESAQADLESLSSRIAAFKPTKIFVEFPYSKQDELDKRYARYLRGDLLSDPKLRDAVRKGEIAQLAFRAAKKLGLKKLYAVDYNETDFPYEETLNAMNAAEQKDLLAELQTAIQAHGDAMNKKIDSGATLMEILAWLNAPESRSEDASVYLDLFNRAGVPDNFEGARLVSEWYRRNLYIWSLIQKQCEPSDERIMVLFGAGHTTIFDQLLSRSHRWETVPWHEFAGN